jgi:hypothetical protein
MGAPVGPLFALVSLPLLLVLALAVNLGVLASAVWFGGWWGLIGYVGATVLVWPLMFYRGSV